MWILATTVCVGVQALEIQVALMGVRVLSQCEPSHRLLLFLLVSLFLLESLVSLLCILHSLKGGD